MPVISTQDMTSSAKRTQICELIRCTLAAHNVIDMRFFKRYRNLAPHTTPAVTLPDSWSYVYLPHLTRRTFSGHGVPHQIS